VTFRWKAPQPPSKETLFTLGKDYRVTLGDFTNYLGDQTRQRAGLARQGTPQDAARNLYQQFINDQLLKYEEIQLEVKYPEFKALMREYEEGILLFEATRQEVWDRASQDSVGLERFFATATGKYSWLERGRITTYRVGMSYKDQVASIQEFARTHTAEEVKAKFNTAEGVVVTSEEGLYEKGRNPITAKMLWKVGGMSLAEDNTRSRSVVFYKIEEIVPPGPKTLNEARGYVIADYQDQLERDWVEGLRRKFKVQINQKIFDSLVR
jgi:peptidyl-prolyl cis-trans isomerase SurA